MNFSDNSLKQKLMSAKDTTRVKVRFNDTDTMGVVHFKNYMVYFDDGFVSFMNSIKNKKYIEEMIHEGLACGVKHVEITYEGSAKFGDYVLVKTSIKQIGNTSLTFNHELFKETDNTLLAKVEAVRFVLNLKNNKLMNIMDFFEYFLK
ncbi:MAG: acyl-CoA thioesterase [Candidatus Lokiarchaeota archaeon]|nr:acyl-CoA thioesterase [Candidatus Lokiarchaeota archaeon]